VNGQRVLHVCVPQNTAWSCCCSVHPEKVLMIEGCMVR